MKKQFVLEEHQTALVADSLPSSVPLTNPKTHSPSEISSHFGTISYNKGTKKLFKEVKIEDFSNLLS